MTKFKPIDILAHAIRFVETAWSTSVLSKLYAKIAKKELPEQTKNRGSILDYTAIFLGIFVVFLSVTSTYTTVLGWIHPPVPLSPVRVLPPFPAPPPPAPAPPVQINPCEDESAFEDAVGSGYDSLVVFFRGCPFVDAKTEHIVQEAVGEFQYYSKEFGKEGKIMRKFDADQRAMVLSTALVEYTFEHSTIQMGTKTTPGDPNVKTPITPWPDPPESDEDDNW